MNRRRRTKRKPINEPVQEDLNDLYGTYYDGPGKSSFLKIFKYFLILGYITMEDTNVDYAAPDEDDHTIVTDLNPHYGH